MSMFRDPATCGYEWRDAFGEHRCYSPMSHPSGTHVCECNAKPPQLSGMDDYDLSMGGL